ncbi:MAG TPA: histidine kinase [Pseudonocardiaceae bacterium]|jgi:signal transduction histidine kinase|nr:histidine kinase [Pseudonocardiaceae bacterium]
MIVTSENARSDRGTRGRRARLVAVRRCLALVALLPVQVGVLAMELLVAVALLCCHIYLWPGAVVNTRWLPNLRRRLAAEFAGLDLPSPYLPEPEPPEAGPDGFYRAPHGLRLYSSYRLPLWQQRGRWAWADPATWRDLSWLVVDPLIGGLLAVTPVAFLGGGLLTMLWPLLPVTTLGWLLPLGGSGLGGFTVPVGIVGGAGIALLGWLLAPTAVGLHARWSAVLLAPARTDRRPLADVRWPGTIAGELLNCARFVGLSIAAALVFVGQVVALAFTGPLLGISAVRHGRALPDAVRCLVFESTGIRIDTPYRPLPAAPPSEQQPPTGDQPPLWPTLARRWKWLAGDPATWRDLLWLGLQPLVGCVLLLLPLLVFAYGWLGLAVPGIQGLVGLGSGPWYGSIAGSHLLAIGVGLAAITVTCCLLSTLLTWHGRWVALLLTPTKRAQLLIERDQLTERVATLTESRSAVVDTQASEVRRIERDLHDGAQARLVAMGMTLGAVEALIDHDPAAAKKLLSQARDASRTALQELRDLVRGIHPPVLAERGLADAIRALALDSPLTVLVNAQLAGRAEAPVESAAYFAVAEALANATKHAQAHRVWIDLRHEDGTLLMTVLDDGHGGADASRGSGLRGIERRLSTFDGRFTLSSPLGGPTMVAMELPCVLSSPRTSTSSGTA